jgi:nucleotide-binding universal stress UspA family protein
MSLKNILVHLDQTPQSANRFDLALSLAKRHQTHLTCYFTTTTHYLLQGGEKELRNATRSNCAAKAATAGVNLIWAESDEVEAILPLSTRLTHQASYADLCIIGQPGNQPPPPRDLPGQLILYSGRPVITIPFAGHFRSLGKRVMVAWKAGRASNRAITDALPFLTRAAEVILISLSSNNDEWKENDRTLSKIEGYLEHHGVAAKLENRMIADIGLGDALLNRAADEAIDLLVCGGMVSAQLAPLASHLLRQMTVPVLMSS